MVRDLLFVKGMLAFFTDNVWNYAVLLGYNFYIIFGYAEQAYIFAHEKSLMPRTMEEMLCTKGVPWEAHRYT